MSTKIIPFLYIHLKIQPALIITSWNFCKIKQFCWCDLKICISPIIKSWNFLKNKAVLLKCFEHLNCPYHHELNFGKNYGRFYEVTWKFGLPLLSRAEIFSKAVLLKCFESLNCPYYLGLKFSQKNKNFVEVFWKLELPLLPAEIFTKIKRFCWSDLKIWPAPISQAGIFAKIRQIWCHWKIELALLLRG